MLVVAFVVLLSKCCGWWSAMVTCLRDVLPAACRTMTASSIRTAQLVAVQRFSRQALQYCLCEPGYVCFCCCLQDNDFQFIPNRSVRPGFKLEADKPSAE
jgi:hypothetical protein